MNNEELLNEIILRIKNKKVNSAYSVGIMGYNSGLITAETIAFNLKSELLLKSAEGLSESK